jgi:hypothetical protein
LSDVSLSYTLPEKFFPFSGIRQVKLGLNATNILTFSGYSGQDPEFNNWIYQEREAVNILPGIDRNYYPVSRSFLFSMQLDF